MTSRLRTLAPPSGSNDYWSAISDWSRPLLDTRDVGQMLGMEEGAVRQQGFRAERGSSRFPVPARFGRAKRWSADQIYDYIRAKRPRLLTAIPALHLNTTAGELAPAVFVAAERWQGTARAGNYDPAKLSLVVHYWKPGDGRGSQVALAYPASSTPMSRADAAAVGAILAQQLFRNDDDDPDSTQALAVVTDELRPLGADAHRQQPAVIVIERGNRRYPPMFAPSITVMRATSRAADDAGTTTVAEIGWFDLAYLLRTDLPWWPCALRSPSVVAAWHPGQSERVAAPLSSDRYSPRLMRMLVDSVTGDRNAAVFRELVERIQGCIEHELYPEGAGAYQLPGGLDQPIAGIIQAAFPAFSTDMGSVLTAPTPVEIAWLLNRPASDIIDLADVLTFLPQARAVTSAAEVTFHSGRGPLAQEWSSRLTVADEVKLGHAFVWKHSRMGTAEDGWTKPSLSSFVPLIDPLDPASWALLAEDGDIYYSVGTRVGGAAGQLQALEVNGTRGFGGATFFRDGQGIVWPAPLGSHSALNKEALAAVVRALRSDARCDTAGLRPGNRPSPRIDQVFGGLPPWHGTAAELDAAL